MYKISDDDFASSAIFKLRKVSKITLSMLDRHLTPCLMANTIRNWILQTICYYDHPINYMYMNLQNFIYDIRSQKLS